MFKDSKAFSGFSVDDIEKARQFYGDTLGLKLEQHSEPMPMLELHTHGNNPMLVYTKPDHTPASFTILNFPVDDIDAAVAELKGKGVSFEVIEGMEQDGHGIMRGKQMGMGPDIAWFKDPAGNSLAVMQD